MQYTKTEVRERLLNVALEEFINNGYEDTSMRSIVKNANSSLGNCYRYFKNKKDLFDAIVNPMVEDCINQSKNFVLDPKQFKIISYYIVDFYYKNEKIFKILRQSSYSSYNDFLSKLSIVFSEKIESSVKVKVENKKIFEILSNAFINGLKYIMENITDKNSASKELEELLNIIFKDLDSKLV